MTKNDDFFLERLGMSKFFSDGELIGIFEQTVALTARISKVSAGCSAVKDFQKAVAALRQAENSVVDAQNHTTMAEVMFCFQSLKRYLDAMTTDPDESLALMAQKYYVVFENIGGITDKQYEKKIQAIEHLINIFSSADDKEFLALGLNSRFSRLIKTYKKLETNQNQPQTIDNSAIINTLRENAIITFNRLVNHVEQMTRIEGDEFYGKDFISSFKSFLQIKKDIENQRRRVGNKKTITVIKPKDEYDVEFEIETNVGD